MTSSSPKFDPLLFWDGQYDEIDWVGAYKYVIQRVAERGDENNWKELLRFYGEWQVRYTLMNEAVFWLPEIMDRVSERISCPKEDMYCYKHASHRNKILSLRRSLHSRSNIRP